MPQETADPLLSVSDEAGQVFQLPPTPVLPDQPPSTQFQPSQPPIEEDQQPIHTDCSDPVPPSEPNVSAPLEPEQLTQYIPQPYGNPLSQSIPQSVPPSDSNRTPQSNQSNPLYEIEGRPKVNKRRSTKRPPPTGQSFIPNPDPDKPPTFYVPVDEDDFSDENPGHHCYESKELHSIASDEDTDHTSVFPQSNADAPNRRPKEYAHNWLTMGAYNAAYQTSMRPVPSQEFWEHLDTLPILPPRYRKPIGRPTTKRDKRNDGPKEKSDPRITARRIGTIICKYCLQASHNKGSCKKRKEAMGEGSSALQAPADDEDEDILAEMYWKETLEAAEAKQEATEEGNGTATAHTTQQPQPMPPPPTTQPQPPTNNATTRKQVKRRSVKRPPPTGQTQQPRTPPPDNQLTTTPSTHNSQTIPHPL
ncbi:hypothetical protein Ahy_B10g101936 [Arachis hypogaea]|uniref:Uncharacterized protein n=1 Tax=Arachis hypogaea TaxID=3818 RepID=A0A444X0P2_ARAHY|nr:hypothetical protein Ahy_B10g101936 [Arachis hypogaea]